MDWLDQNGHGYLIKVKLKGLAALLDQQKWQRFQAVPDGSNATLGTSVAHGRDQDDLLLCDGRPLWTPGLRNPSLLVTWFMITSATPQQKG